MEPTSLPGCRVLATPTFITDQIVDPLEGLGLGLGCRLGCRSDKAGLGTAEQIDEESEEQQGSGRN
jgi:hypothetical protein